MINEERVKQLFLELVHINSPSHSEREVANFLKTKLQSIGFDIKEDDSVGRTGSNTPNIVATKRGTVSGAKSIFLGAHMDTVQPTENIRVVEEGGVIKTDCTTILGADDKAGIAAIIEGITSVLDSNVEHGDVQVVLNVAEEIGLMGSKAMDKSLITSDFGFIFDTQKPAGGITVSAPSHETMLVKIFGKASHAGMAPEFGVNAIVAASNAICGMKIGRVDEETTANVGVISGGKARNIVPDRVDIKAEARSRSEEKLTRQVEYMKSRFVEEAEKMGATVDFESMREYEAFLFERDDEIVKLATRASEAIGLQPVYQDGGGGSDANIFNSAGLPTLIIGVGYDGAHSVDENISVADLVTSARYAESLIKCAAEV